MAPVQAVPMAGDIFGEQPLKISQRFELLEAVTGCETKNKYDIEGAAGGPMFVHEESECMKRICCGPQRELTLFVHMGSNKEAPVIVKFHKDCHLDMDCPCLRPTMQVYDINDNQLGRVHDPCNCCCLTSNAYDAQDNHLYQINGNPCQLGLCCRFPNGTACVCDVNFDITNMQNENAAHGQITKKWGGLKEVCGTANNFEVVWPQGCDVNTKSLLLASVFLVDIQNFERSE
jgi:hypothetical protein